MHCKRPVPSQDDDGLDPRAWEQLRFLVMAANSGDREAFKGEITARASSTSLGAQHRVGLYLFAAVKYMVRVSVQGDPTEADLKSLAARCFPYVETVLTPYPLAVEDALRSDFDKPFIRRELRPGELLLLNAAITSWLLDQLGAELREVREWVAQWWKVNARAIHDAGVQDK
jgi:hypothetical protein